MTEESISSNKRIAKNTLLLYGRMLLMTFVGLFTTRVILQALGVSDLGLMNVAGGVLSAFTFFQATLSGATQRFITFALGKGDLTNSRKVFASSMTIHAILAGIIFLIGETIGLWYITQKLNIEPGRFEAAMWCYQLSILGSMLGLIQVPFNAALIAHERMGVYAYTAIFDALYKLLMAYVIMIVPYDRVIFYSTAGFLYLLPMTYFYNWYCRKHFSECSFTFGYDKKLFCDIFSFVGWNALGSMAFMGQSTGVNLVINLFCGTVVNGARSIAFQANGWINKFVENFMTAVRPQIIKLYAVGRYQEMGNLVISSAKYSSYLYLLLGIPLFIEIEWVMELWLGHCPDYVAVFLRITMVETLIKIMGEPTKTAMHATGQMKGVNLTVAIILLSILPISYLLFRLGADVVTVTAINVIPWILAVPVRILWVNKYCNHEFPIRRFLWEVMGKVSLLTVAILCIPLLVHWLTESIISDFLQFLSVGITSVICSSIIIYFLGLDHTMRQRVNLKLAKVMSKLRR